MKIKNIDNIPFYPLDKLKGTRYTIQQVKPLLTDLIDIQNDMVLPAIAEQISKLLSGKPTTLLSPKNGQRGSLHVINNVTTGLSIWVRTA